MDARHAKCVCKGFAADKTLPKSGEWAHGAADAGCRRRSSGPNGMRRWLTIIHRHVVSRGRAALVDGDDVASRVGL